MNEQFSDDQLLKMAMGVPDEGTEEATEIMKMKTEEQFLERYAGTPLMRAKLKGLQRNAKATLKKS